MVKIKGTVIVMVYFHHFFILFLSIIMGLAIIIACPAFADDPQAVRRAVTPAPEPEMAPLTLIAGKPHEVPAVQGAPPPVAQAMPEWWDVVDRPSLPRSKSRDKPDE